MKMIMPIVWTALVGCSHVDTEEDYFFQEAVRVEKVQAPMAPPEPITISPTGEKGMIIGPEAPEEAEPITSVSTAHLISRANKQARHLPSEYGFINAVHEYDYMDGAVYKIYSAPLKSTAISLEPGEKVLGDVIAGDSVRWKMQFSTGKVDGVDQQHLFIKPTRPNLNTNLTITTDRRVYHLELHSFKNTYMVSTRWNYPKKQMDQYAAQLERQEKREEDALSTIDYKHLNFDYDVKIVQKASRRALYWKPSQIFDDGKKTYIKMPESSKNREIPSLYVLSDENDVQLANYRFLNGYFIVDRIFHKAEMRLGQKKQSIVRIINRS